MVPAGGASATWNATSSPDSFTAETAENAERNGNGKSKGMHHRDHREHREEKGLREGKGRKQEMIQGGVKPVAGLFFQPESSVLSVFSVVKAVAVSFSLPFSLRSLRSRR